MTCNLVCHLFDDYLDGHLSPNERLRLERHVSGCSHCSQELQDQMALERTLRQALASSVQRLQLSPEASRTIVQAVASNTQPSPWSHRATRLVQMTAGLAVVVLLLASAFFLLGRLPARTSVQQALFPAASQPALSLDRADIVVEPGYTQPGDLFTVTVPIHSDMIQPLESVRTNLDIDGPSGQYRFAVSAQGPFPTQGISVLHVTPELLAAPCEEQYQISPREILSAPGVYTFRVTVFSPVTAIER